MVGLGQRPGLLAGPVAVGGPGSSVSGVAGRVRVLVRVALTGAAGIAGDGPLGRRRVTVTPLRLGARWVVPAVRRVVPAVRGRVAAGARVARAVRVAGNRLVGLVQLAVATARRLRVGGTLLVRARRCLGPLPGSVRRSGRSLRRSGRRWA